MRGILKRTARAVKRYRPIRAAKNQLFGRIGEIIFPFSPAPRFLPASDLTAHRRISRAARAGLAPGNANESLYLNPLFMSSLSFHKMHGAGNDFVVLDGLSRPIAPALDIARLAQLLCIRRFGVGADGLLTLEPSDVADARMRMWNPDGTPDMCGNGLRCVAELAHKLGHIQKENFSIETIAGVRQIEKLRDGRIRTAMGVPQWAPAIVPIDAATPLVNGQIEVGGEVLRNVSALSTGSTHTVIFRDTQLSEAEFQTLSPQLENHPLFPARTSVMWAIADESAPDGADKFKIRIWERGAGETLACGTGACAVGVAAIATGRAHGPIRVESRGGELEVEWNESDGEIALTGRATYVYAGEVDLED